jgi:phage gp45-like
MSDSLFKQLGAKIRNIFSPGLFQKRYDDDGRIQIKTYSGHVLEKKEAFPYGFTAKAKDGRALVFCIGGNFNSFEILPLIAGDKVKPPELEEGDAALYTESGGWITVRENGTVELFGTDAGGVVKAKELKSQLDKLSARVDGIMDALNNSPTVPQDGGSSYKGEIAVKLATLVDKENFSKLESEKVLHGTGK